MRVYPGFNALYYSFYLAGARTVAGATGLRFSTAGFPKFGHHGLALEVGDKPQRIFLSASDGPGLQPDSLAWCDVYGKANLDPERVPPEMQERCLAIGPSFPIRLWGPAAAWTMAVANYLRCGGRVDSPREHFANYRRQYRYRLPLAAYEPKPSRPPYVFFAASLWKKEETTNRLRANFVEACQSLPEVDFEGGFAPRTHNDIPGFEHVTGRRYSIAEYHRRMQRSAIAFNTPAVLSCHGWKLAELMALGKAIISTPLVRAMPVTLEHGEQVHFVDGSLDSIRDAVQQLIADDDYRHRLQQGARDYYLRYLAPQRVIERVLQAAERIHS